LLGHRRIKNAVDERVGSDGSGDKTGDRKTIPTRCSSYPAINVGLLVPKMAGTKKSGWEPLLLHHVIEIRGKGSGGMHKHKGSCCCDQLDELVAVRSSPLVSEGTSKSRTKGKGLAELVEVQHGG
jgi:hypothetical protein